MTLKVTQGHRNCLYSIGHVSFLLVVCNKNDATWHHLQTNITTSTVYVTGCDLELSFTVEKTVEITSHVRFPIHV